MIAGGGRWGEWPPPLPARSPVVGVVVEVVELGFRVARVLIASDSRGKVIGGDGPTVVAFQPPVEARRRGSTAGRWARPLVGDG